MLTLEGYEWTILGVLPVIISMNPIISHIGEVIDLDVENRRLNHASQGRVVNPGCNDLHWGFTFFKGRD